MEPMMDSLETGFYHLKQEEAQLKERAEQKEKTGNVSRMKVSAKKPLLFLFSVCSVRFALLPSTTCNFRLTVAFGCHVLTQSEF